MPRWEVGMNPEQLSVIRHGAGPLQVLAQAGTGKTRALTHRIVRLVVEEGVDPARILAVTFSAKAAAEMRERVEQLGVEGCQIQTWHSLCLRILRDDQTHWGAWEIDKSDRAKGHLKEILGFKNMGWAPKDFGTLRRWMGICEANLWAPDSTEALTKAREMMGRDAPNAVRAYHSLIDRLEQLGVLTFDRMLVYAAQHLASDEYTRTGWAARWQYVMQDEAQDANRAQTTIAELLARDHANYMIVGDPAQSIYGFRGSSPLHVHGFADEWPNTTRVAMVRNYRSAAAIVAAANVVIEPAEVRLPEDMVAAREGAGEGSVRVMSAASLEDEAKAFVEHVRMGLVDGASPADYCCLFLLNAQSRALEDALLNSRIPYEIVGGVNFFERKEVKDLLAYLRVAAEGDLESIKRCINAPFRFLGKAFVERVGQEASAGGDWQDVVQRAAAATGVQSRQRASAADWVELVNVVKAGITSDPPARPNKLLEHIVTRTRYIEWIEREEGEESIESSHGANVRELIRVAGSFATVADLLEHVRDSQAKATKQARGRRERVLLMSIHRSKGLEWPHVWIVGCNEMVFPHPKGDQEEERRLMYVATTRARDSLVCSHVERMALRSGEKDMRRSRFIDELFDAEVAMPFERVVPLAPPADDSAPAVAFDVQEGGLSS